MWKLLFEALIKGHKDTAVRNAVAKHLAQGLIYESEGLNLLYPEFRKKIDKVIARMEAVGQPVVLSEGFRSFAKQRDYYAKGRTTSGAIITNAKEGQSWHQYGLASDLISSTHGWQAPQTFWNRLGIEAKKEGLEWGGDWQFKDYAHVQYRPESVEWKELRPYFIK